MSGHLTIKPAYGRKYTTAEAVKADWNGGKDFQILGAGSYINNQDADAFGVRSVTIQYGNKRTTIVIEK